MHSVVPRLMGVVNFWALLASFLVVRSVASQSCNSTSNTGFGLGAHTIPPATNVSTAPSTGPYEVGISFETYCFENRSLTVSYWYPAKPGNDSIRYVSSGGIAGDAFEDAAIDSSDAPYPLIVFSSGLAAVNDAYYFYCQNLASNGYIVASAQHLDARNANTTTVPALLALAAVDALAGNTNDAVITEYTEWFRETQFALTYRPQEIQFNLEQALAAADNSSSKFYGTIDKENIGMTGHSIGGFYTNVIGGGMPIYCDYPMTPAEMDPENPILASVSPCAFPARQNLSGPFALHDSRIKAIVPLAAPSFLTKTQIARAATQIEIPMMMITGDNFTSETTQWIQEAVYNNAAGPSYYVEVIDTDHFLVADAYGLNPYLALAAGGEDTVNFLDKAAVYMTYSTAFFDYYVKGNKAAFETLHTVSSSFVKQLKYRND
ncbi:putative Alpha/beta-hydrolase [Seiridium cardinale]